MTKREKWIVAVSGGPDSMALLDMLNKQGYELITAHVNYLTRETSLRDEDIVRKYCDSHGIVFRVKKFEVEQVNNFQNDARNFRYEFFKELVSEYNASGVAVGHHFNDDVETYVFQKNRNMFSDHIGMDSNTKIKGISIWRPLLSYTKDYLVEYCLSNNINYGIDESNLELDYTRNKIRHAISKMSKIEYNELIEEMKNKREEWKKFQDTMHYSVNSWEKLVPLKSYAKIAESKRFFYLRQWLRHNQIDVRDMSEDYLEEMDRNILKKSANYQFGKMVLISSYEDIAIIEITKFEYIMDEVEFFKTEFFEIVDEGLKIQGLTVSKEDFPLIIRNAQAGDKIRMRYGSKKVNRYFIDEKIPHSKRMTLPVIENAKKELIFVAGMGCDVHHFSNNPSFYMVE